MPVSLPLTLGSTSPTALAAPVVLGMMLIGRGAAAAPIFLARAVDGFLGRRRRVNGRHQAGFDSDAFLEKHVNQRREAVGRAGGVGDDVVLGRIVFVFIHADEEGLHFALAGGGDDDFLGAGGQMSLGLFRIGEKPGGFDDILHAKLFPGELRGLLGGHDALGGMAVDDEGVVFFLVGFAFLSGDLVLEMPVDRIVFELIGEIFGVRGDIDDGNDVDGLAEQALIANRLKNQPADAAETINSDF